LAVTDYTSLKSFNASAVTGAVTFSAVANNKQITTGSGADSFTINDADTTTLNIDGGSGIDTVVFTASDDYSSGTLNFSNIEKLSVVNSSITLAASQLNGSSYIIYADGADTLAVNVMSAVGETVNLSDVTASQAVITVTGNDGVDVITAPSTYGITINAGSGNDNITGGGGNDTISGEGGSDTINISSGGTDTIHLAASGKDTIIGFGTTDVINVEALSGGDTDFESAVVKGAASAVTSKTAYILSTDGTAANLTTSGTATVSDFTNLTQVAAYLEERFNVADNDVAAFIVNVGTTTYVYDMNDADDTTIGSTDLTLVA
jgi:Ca2+-binding RTX toxin-like protein